MVWDKVKGERRPKRIFKIPSTGLLLELSGAAVLLSPESPAVCWGFSYLRPRNAWIETTWLSLCIWAKVFKGTLCKDDIVLLLSETCHPSTYPTKQNFNTTKFLQCATENITLPVNPPIPKKRKTDTTRIPQFPNSPDFPPFLLPSHSFTF